MFRRSNEIFRSSNSGRSYWKRNAGPIFLESPEWDGIWNNLALPGASVGVIYFVLGYYLYRNINWISKKMSLGLYFCSVIFISGLNAICAIIGGAHVAVASGYLSAGIFLSSIGFFTFIIQYLVKYRIPNVWEVRLRNMADYTLGIYLVHTFFIEQVFRRIGLYQEKFTTLIAVVLFSVLTLICSYFTVWCIRRIPVFGKWII